MLKTGEVQARHTNVIRGLASQMPANNRGLGRKKKNQAQQHAAHSSGLPHEDDDNQAPATSLLNDGHGGLPIGRLYLSHCQFEVGHPVSARLVQRVC